VTFWTEEVTLEVLGTTLCTRAKTLCQRRKARNEEGTNLYLICSITRPISVSQSRYGNILLVVSKTCSHHSAYSTIGVLPLLALRSLPYQVVSPRLHSLQIATRYYRGTRAPTFILPGPCNFSCRYYQPSGSPSSVAVTVTPLDLTDVQTSTSGPSSPS
jgi:hypothetical protein